MAQYLTPADVTELIAVHTAAAIDRALDMNDEQFLTSWTAEQWDADDLPMPELPALI